MGIIDFVKSAGKALGILSNDSVKKEVEDYGLDVGDLDISVDGDKVVIEGMPNNPEEREKIITAIGNIEGISAVDDAMGGDLANDFYTVRSGDTLSAIAQEVYGDGGRYQEIFEANTPMLDHPDKIYPGQVLVIPKD